RAHRHADAGAHRHPHPGDGVLVVQQRDRLRRRRALCPADGGILSAADLAAVCPVETGRRTMSFLQLRSLSKRYGPVAALDGLERNDPRRAGRIAELMQMVGLETGMLRRRPDELSGGQQQRVALARALARKPRLMLLDEPFSALDTGLRASTRKAVADLLSAAGITTILVTHDQAEALSFADQVAVMREGQL